MFKEIVLELSGGTPDGAHARYFFERSLTARMRVIHATPTASWEKISVTGRPDDVADLRARLERGPNGAMEDVEIVSVTPRSIQYVVKWTRDCRESGTPLDFLLHEVVGPDAMYAMCIEKGRIRVTVAGADGEKLLTYVNRVRDELADRFTVRLLRVGDLSGTFDGADSQRDHGLGAEDRDLVELALASGYYDNPKRCGVRELGDAIGCSKSVIARRLRTIERRALESILRPPEGRATQVAPQAAPGVPLLAGPHGPIAEG